MLNAKLKQLKTNTVYLTRNKRYVLTGSDIKNDYIEVFELEDRNDIFWQLKSNGTFHVFNHITQEYIGSSSESPGYRSCSDIIEEIISFEQFPPKLAIPKPKRDELC